MKKRSGFSKPKLTLRQAQLSINSQAPHGFINAESKFPIPFLDETPRAQRTTPNKHDEKNFVNALLKTCNQYYLHNIKPIWLRKNVNGTYRPMGVDTPVRVGLGTGVGDCVGYTVKLVTADMVGKKIAIYTEVEAKLTKGGVISTAQQDHHDQVERDGGIALFAYDADGVNAVIDRLVP